MKLGHIGLPVRDLGESKKIYDSVIKHLGLEFINETETSVRYGEDGSARFYIHTRNEGVSNVHICFDVETKEQVDAFYQAALKNGATDHGAPGIREDYSPTYYAAFVLDPDGNNIEAVCRN